MDCSLYIFSDYYRADIRGYMGVGEEGGMMRNNVFLAVFTLLIFFSCFCLGLIVGRRLENTKERIAIKTLSKDITEIMEYRERSKEKEYTCIDWAPDPNDFNDKFAQLGELLDVEIPYSFLLGGDYSQIEVNENFDVIIEALEKELLKENIIIKRRFNLDGAH